MKTGCFGAAEILLPDFEKTDGTKWSVVACDQYTSEPEYWHAVEQTVGNAPSTLRLMLPEIFLSEREERIPGIHRAMRDALEQTLECHPDAMIFVERTQSDGRVRRGIVGAIDLEAYDYRRGSTSLIRATEGTVLERIPPRVAVRRGAPLELPHVMLLIDDREKSVIEPLMNRSDSRPAYDFDLMAGGGHIRGAFLSPDAQKAVRDALAKLIAPEAMRARYGDAKLAPLLFAVGDGNHSLASAKAYYEELKESLGEERAKRHPARYALAEIVNLHDDALTFEPIYRVLFHVEPAALLAAFRAELSALSGTAAPQEIEVICANGAQKCAVQHPDLQLPVATLQRFLDRYLASHPSVSVDYIHGEETVRSLVAAAPDRVGFLFAGMEKTDLFRTVLFDGALPRKTFSMGHAQDKRFYLECRKI